MKIYTEDTHEARFLIIECSAGGDTFEDRMIEGLDLPSLLRPVKFSDREERYDISCYSSLEDLMKNRSLKKDEITDLLLAVDTSIRYLEERMLGDSNILIDPKYVFCGPAGDPEVYFPVTRGMEGSFQERMRLFTELLFTHADSDDPESLRFASGLMKICLMDSFRMHDIMRFIEKNRKESVNMRPVVNVKAEETEGILIQAPVFDEMPRQELFEQEIANEIMKRNLSDGKKVRIILLIAAAAISFLDIVCMILGNSRAASLLPFLMILSAAAVGYNIYAALVNKKQK